MRQMHEVLPETVKWVLRALAAKCNNSEAYQRFFHSVHNKNIIANYKSLRPNPNVFKKNETTNSIWVLMKAWVY